MKKNFTLMMLGLLLLALGANAQNYRKWDFSNWSATTVANLVADASASSTEGWSDIEKAADAGEGKVAPEATAGKCYWEASMQGTADGATLVANGEVISELEGLLFVHTAAKRNLAIAVNYPETSLGTYHGGAYLWLGGSKKDYFIIPNVKPGQPIKIGVESHKPTDARGIELYIYSDKAKGDKLTAPDGSDVAVPTTYQDQEWTVPSNAEGQNEEGNYDILVYNTNGCHLYYIEVGTADQKSKIAYLYQGEADGTLAVAQGIANYEVEAIDVATTTITADQLKGYDAVLVAANIAADNAAVATIKETISWTPVVNTNAALYAAWGYGEAADADTEFLLVNNAGNELMRGIELTEDEEGLLLPLGGNISGIALGDYFKADVVPAIPFGTENVAGAHIHNSGHNAYIYVPTAADATEEAQQLLANAITAAANSKAKITATPAPTFSLDYKNLRTLVSLKDTNADADIYYTTDGTTPTTASTLYSEPIEVTAEGVTVKAVAIADGYTLSEVAEQAIDLKIQAVEPAVSVEQAGGKTIVTVTGEGTIWYNYAATNDSVKSTKYTGPVTLTMPRSFSAFVSEEGKVNSEPVTIDVAVNGYQPRIDIVAHMDANSAEYNGGSTSTAYYFSWGKNKSGENGYNFYNVDAGYTETVVVNPETGDEETVKAYNELNPEEEKDFGNGWMVRSRGQLTIWENQTTGTNYGDTNGYNYASVDDENPYFPATKGYINLADKNTIPSDATFPYNAYIVSTQKFKGPFDIVANIGSITKPENEAKHEIVLQVSTDGYIWESNWQTVGDTISIKNRQRLTTNVTRSYEGTDEVYVRAYLNNMNSKVGFYDIYIANAGEKSAELISGISEQPAAPALRQSAVYNLNGTRQQRLQRGLNIVVENGVARKVMVK